MAPSIFRCTWIAKFLFIGLGHCVQKEQDFKNKLSRLRAEMRAQFVREQRAKGLVNFIDRLGRERWGTPEQVKEWKIIDIDMRNNFARLSPREFEKLIANLLQQMGYKTQLTPKTADYGADIVAKKGVDTLIVQVKRYGYSHKVGNRGIQQLLGSMWKYKANKAIFVTSSDFTNFAYEQAAGAPVELWNHRRLCKMIEKFILTSESSGR